MTIERSPSDYPWLLSVVIEAIALVLAPFALATLPKADAADVPEPRDEICIRNPTPSHRSCSQNSTEIGVAASAAFSRPAVDTGAGAHARERTDTCMPPR